MENEIIRQKRKRGRPRKQQPTLPAATDNQQEQGGLEPCGQSLCDGSQPCGQSQPSDECAGPQLLRANIYRALPFIFPKIKVVALSAIMGKDNSWINNRLRETKYKSGQTYHFAPGDLPVVNSGLHRMGELIIQNLVEYCDDRDELNRRVKQLARYVAMPYIYRNSMKMPDGWYKDRMRPTKPKYNLTFTNLDIMCVNYVARQIANELMSVETVL